MSARRLAAVLGFLAVALGAFGAHGLKAWLDSEDPAFAVKAMDWWRTAALYHLVHAVAIVAASRRLADPDAGPVRAGPVAWCFTAGIVLFSGSLYAMALGAPTRLGMVTPIGGLAFLAGWFALFARRN